MEKHYICTGGCGGVAETSGTCKAEDCPNHGEPLEECSCTDGAHSKKESSDMEKGISMPLVGVVAAVIILILGAFYYTGNNSQNAPADDMLHSDDAMKMEEVAMMEKAEPTKDAMMKDVDEAMMKDMMAMAFEYSGQLDDVTGGDTVRGISTGGNGSGVAQANYKDGAYDLLVTFKNIPDPEGTDFYEGWIVRRGDNFSVISTGKVEKVDGVYTNAYSSGEDLTDHDFYVLTIEPDDGNPAPADHIVEGVMFK
jgi:hypothetical protein